MTIDPLAVQSEKAARAAVYAALKRTNRLQKQRVIAYWCEQRHDLLLDVVSIPSVVIGHLPRYKLAGDRNDAASNHEGRQANTVDGDRRWKAQTFDMGSALNLTLNCDHVHGVVLELDDVQADLDAGWREMVVSPAGKRYAR